VSEFANLNEDKVVRASETTVEQAASVATQPAAALDQIGALPGGKRIAAAVLAAREGASLNSLTAALAGTGAVVRGEPLPVRRHAEPYEVLRARAERAGHERRPSAFLCNLGPIPKHKARASFASGFLNAGGIAALDNDGFATPELAADAFAAAGTPLAVICGADDQYPEWVPKLAPLLRARGATQILLAGRPGEHEAAFKTAGVSDFIFVGVDVVATLSQLLDRLGVAS
jgi:methylmalonyl-CoA mutase